MLFAKKSSSSSAAMHRSPPETVRGRKRTCEDNKDVAKTPRRIRPPVRPHRRFRSHLLEMSWLSRVYFSFRHRVLPPKHSVNGASQKKRAPREREVRSTHGPRVCVPLTGTNGSFWLVPGGCCAILLPHGQNALKLCSTMRLLWLLLLDCIQHPTQICIKGNCCIKRGAKKRPHVNFVCLCFFLFEPEVSFNKWNGLKDSIVG